MKGYQVERKRGRDCHGLPVEKAVEKSLGIDGKRDIENKIGIEKFTKECRKYVSDTNDAWQWVIDHIGRRADIDNAYYSNNTFEKYRIIQDKLYVSDFDRFLQLEQKSKEKEEKDKAE